VWQRYWAGRGEDFLMLAVAQDAQGAERVEPIARAAGVTFPVVVDSASAIAAALSLRLVPAGVFVDDGAVRHVARGDFDVADPRVRARLDAFLRGDPVESEDDAEPIDPRALELFAAGVSAYGGGDRDGALALWRRALAVDPDNFLIRSQIWSVEHPDGFWPVVDRAWQELQLAKEGYDGPLP
jgi:hypothetical protein